MKIKIKKGFRDKTLVSFTTRAGIFAALFVLFSSSVFANSFRYTQIAKMDEEQTHYYNVILNDETTVNTHLFTFDLEALKNDQLTFNLPDGKVYHFNRGESRVTFGSRKGWVGKTEGSEAHLIPHYRKQYLTGTIFLSDKTYSIRTLGKGLHVLIDYSTSGLPGCGTDEAQDIASEEGSDYHPIDPADVDGIEESNTESLTMEDECYIRILVAYTQPVGTAEADPIGLIMNAVSQTNEAYNNSGINQQLFLARVYETPFDDTGMSQGDVLTAFRLTSDGDMDEVHTERSLYRADMCALITNVGTGIGRTILGYAEAFSCTRRTYVSNKTFQHELGHNHTCHHDPLNYGGSSNYRGYGHPTGVFRTVMAYECPSGGCPRVNEFSGITNTYTTGGTTYSTGNSTQNSVAGHNNNNGTTSTYESIVANGYYAGDYDFADDEYANFAAEDSLRYFSTTNKMEYESGAEGSFVAGHRIRLQRGFHAKSGSSFRAYIDPNCTPISVSGNPPVTEFEGGQKPNEVHGNHNHKGHDHGFGIEKIEAFPNPFSETATIQYAVKEDGPVAVSVFDVNGKQVINLINSSNHSSGEHRVEFDGSKLPAGMYHCRMVTKDGVKVIAISISR